MSKERYLADIIEEMCFLGPAKMAFVVGPRQCGKTTMARSILKARGAGAYYNWDQREFRAIWAREPQSVIKNIAPNSKLTPILIFDEIHKAKLWKRTLKGVFDTLEERVDIIVTGSARLDTYKKGSDSLLGRYFSFRLHPFTVREVVGEKPVTPDRVMLCLEDGLPPATSEAKDALSTLLRFGGFPEPFLAQSQRRALIWRQQRLQQLVREDLRDLSRLPELSQIEMLMSLLPERAASQLSRSALREDLEVAHTTVTRWLNYLEALYYHFEIRPYSKNIKRSLKKEGKLHLWDYAEATQPGQRFENLVAQHLLKACHYWSDCGHGKFELRYLKNTDGAEIDLLIVKDNKAWLPVEVKLSDTNPSPHWSAFLPALGCKFALQLVNLPNYLKIERSGGQNVIVADASRFLLNLV